MDDREVMVEKYDERIINLSHRTMEAYYRWVWNMTTLNAGTLAVLVALNTGMQDKAHMNSLVALLLKMDWACLALTVCCGVYVSYGERRLRRITEKIVHDQLFFLTADSDRNPSNTKKAQDQKVTKRGVDHILSSLEDFETSPRRFLKTIYPWMICVSYVLLAVYAIVR
jgi:hypothetical protein